MQILETYRWKLKVEENRKRLIVIKKCLKELLNVGIYWASVCFIQNGGQDTGATSIQTFYYRGFDFIAMKSTF